MNSKQKLTRRCGLYLKVGKLARMLHKTVNIFKYECLRFDTSQCLVNSSAVRELRSQLGKHM